MDPITLNKLLSVADAIETQRKESRLPLETFHKIIASLGQVKRLERRVQDILRVVEATGWITRDSKDRDKLCLTEDFLKFMHAWDFGSNLLPLNQGLMNYPPYARFLNCLRNERRIEIPQRQDRDSQRELGRTLKDNYNITLVAFDIFRTWAVSVGHAHVSPFDRSLHWGGDWNEERPSLEQFRAFCMESYCQADKTSGYANLGRVANMVCVNLSISFQAFEIKMNKFIETFPGEIRLAPATIRRELSGHFRITSVRPRKDVIRERLSARLQECEMGQIQWLEHRYLEDGIRVKGNLVKLIRWEEEK